MQDLLAIRFIEGTKVSHDYSGNDIKTFSYRDLIDRGIPCIGIPCKINGLVVVDVDVEGPNHKVDGTDFWMNFVMEHELDPTYTVSTQSGGRHYYYRLPEFINPETFSPPAQLAPGVDVKYNGWVGAPPTLGYSVVHGNLGAIQELPQALLDYMHSLHQGRPAMTFESGMDIKIHQPFTDSQIQYLRLHLPFIAANCSLDRGEWRDGIFSLNAGIEDQELLEELITQWTMNKAYVPGDEHAALSMAQKASKHGGVGPATILSIIKRHLVEKAAPSTKFPWTVEEIMNKSEVIVGFDSKGGKKVEPSETNASALLGAMFPEQDLYYDTRAALYIYQGKSYSDVELVNHFMPMIQSTKYGLGLDKFRKQTVATGLDILMSSRQKDPHQEYLRSLKWDGVPRIKKFFTEYVGAKDNEYHRLVGTNFWTALAARGLKPGSKFDSMVVLEGHEGIAKSSLVDAIGGKYTTASSRHDGLENMDELRKMHQAVIVELPELMGLINQSAEKVKAVLAKPYDDIRHLYAKQSKRHDRGFVFFGTTNSQRYLSSAMGHRRFWPVRIPAEVKSVNMSKVLADRDQLFAEGIHSYHQGHAYWYVPSHLLDPVVKNRVMDEPLMTPIGEIVARHTGSFSTHSVFVDLMNQGFIGRGYSIEVVQRIEDSLRRMGFEFHEDGGKWEKKAFEVVVPEEFSLDSLI